MSNPPKPAPLSNQRRNYYIKRPFQRSFILQFCSLIIFACILFGAFLYVYSTRALTTVFIDSRLRVMSTSDFLMPALGLSALLVTAIATVIAAARLLIFSHKIAGPLYRFEKSGETIGAGNLNLRVRLRSQDELQDLAHAMDEMAADLKVRIQAIKEQVDRLGRMTAGSSGGGPGQAELLKELKDIQARLDEQVRHFQV